MNTNPIEFKPGQCAVYTDGTGTTSRHINKYRASWDTLPERTMPQDFFTKLAA